MYSVEAGDIVFTYWNSLGGVGRGRATANGADIRFTIAMRATPDAAPQTAETIWHTAANSYEVTSGGEKRIFRLAD